MTGHAGWGGGKGRPARPAFPALPAALPRSCCRAAACCLAAGPPSPPDPQPTLTCVGHQRLDAGGHRGVLRRDVGVGAEELGGLLRRQSGHAHLQGVQGLLGGGVRILYACEVAMEEACVGGCVSRSRGACLAAERHRQSGRTGGEARHGSSTFDSPCAASLAPTPAVPVALRLPHRLSALLPHARPPRAHPHAPATKTCHCRPLSPSPST